MKCRKEKKQVTSSFDGFKRETNVKRQLFGTATTSNKLKRVFLTMTLTEGFLKDCLSHCGFIKGETNQQSKVDISRNYDKLGTF